MNEPTLDLSDYPEDTRPLDYFDAEGKAHVMCACGHWVSGGVSIDDKIAMCPNCQLILRVTGKVEVVYPDRLPVTIKV